MSRSPRHAVLIDEVRRRSPECPGIYVFRGDRDEIIYVGKAVNLQQRMLSHLRVDPMADPSRHSRMVYEVRDFEFQATGSELLALLREDELIKRHRPRFNVRQNEFLEYKYLELTTDEYPRLRLIDHEARLGNRRVFGPYRGRYFIDDVLGLIHDHLGLRSCSATVPVDRCIQFDLGHCTGPCRNAISPGRYEQVVARGVAFLDGDVSEVAARLAETMESASERLDYEKAHELKERLGFCKRFGERQRFISAFRDRKLVVAEGAGPAVGSAWTYVFQRGRLTARGAAGEMAVHGAEGQPIRTGDPTIVDDDPTIVAGKPLITVDDPTILDDDPRFLLDRAAIVHGWLRRNGQRCRYFFADLDSVG